MENGDVFAVSHDKKSQRSHTVSKSFPNDRVCYARLTGDVIVWPLFFKHVTSGSQTVLLTKTPTPTGESRKCMHVSANTITAEIGPVIRTHSDGSYLEAREHVARL